MMIIIIIIIIIIILSVSCLVCLPISTDPSSMMRLTELLAAADKRNVSPPPLSAEEFYLQQKMFQNMYVLYVYMYNTK